ncbi:SDR family oxidoreductase [Castellaniella sp.]|uniref:SDR family oxidoreductase n=1 Tax=Castellaniella sp. TaxID=1955812 RepID=UPI0035679239
MDFGIAGKRALVCGSSRGLGFGCAQALVAEGVHVTLVARTPQDLQRAARVLEDSNPAVEIHAVAADIVTPEGRDNVFQRTGTDYDILVTNAGGPPPGDFRDWGTAEWQAALQANMLTPIELIKTVVDGMAGRGFGRIVNITSVAVKAPLAQLGLSNGARSGLTGFIAGLARSGLAEKGVTINNLLPGFFATDRLNATFAAEAEAKQVDVEAVKNARLSSIPARRFGNAKEFGEVCAFLCSQRAAYLTGQNILLDGGAYPGTF